MRHGSRCCQQVAFAEGYTAHDKKEVDGASLWVRRVVRLAWYGLFVWLLLQIAQSYGGMGGSEYYYLLDTHSLGALQRKKIPQIRDYCGSGWMGTGIFFLKIIPK